MLCDGIAVVQMLQRCWLCVNDDAKHTCKGAEPVLECPRVPADERLSGCISDKGCRSDCCRLLLSCCFAPDLTTLSLFCSSFGVAALSPLPLPSRLSLTLALVPASVTLGTALPPGPCRNGPALLFSPRSVSECEAAAAAGVCCSSSAGDSRWAYPGLSSCA